MCTKSKKPVMNIPGVFLETWKYMDIHQGSGPFGSGPTGPGSGFSVMPFSWPMKMATTKADQKTSRARNAG